MFSLHTIVHVPWPIHSFQENRRVLLLTNTNITIKKKSNHKESIKRGVIRGFGDRSRALCDQQYLKEELKNVEEIFVENGYEQREVRKALRKKTTNNDETDEEPTTRGTVLMPNIPEFTSKFNSIARRHNFKVANKTTNNVRDLTSNAETPLGDKKSNIVYTIPCKCGEYTAKRTENGRHNEKNIKTKYD